MYIHPLWIFFWDEPCLSRLYEIYLSIKDLKISNKKVIAENQCEKHKKSSLALFWLVKFLIQSLGPMLRPTSRIS